MNTYIAASEVQKDRDLCDQWAVTQQMKCSVDKRTVIEMKLQNNQTKYKKINQRRNISLQHWRCLLKHIYQTFKSLVLLSVFNLKKIKTKHWLLEEMHCHNAVKSSQKCNPVTPDMEETICFRNRVGTTAYRKKSHTDLVSYCTLPPWVMTEWYSQLMASTSINLCRSES